MIESQVDLSLEILEAANVNGRERHLGGLEIAAALLSAAAYKMLAEIKDVERLQPATARLAGTTFQRAFEQAQATLVTLSKQVRHS